MLEQTLGTKYACLNVVGGGTKDGFLMELTSCALRRPVIAGPVEATATGNILVQALANGDLPDLNAVREVVRNSFELKTFEPDTEMAEKYDSVISKFNTIAGK